MEIHRSRPDSRFTVIPNDTLRDPRLSYAARGILGEILSRPDDWQTTAEATWRRGRSERGRAAEGRAEIRGAFAELEAAGYLYRERTRGGRGRVATTLHVFDAPAVRGPDGAPVVLTIARYMRADVSADGTGSRTGGGRCEQEKRASSQVAPTDRITAAGHSAAGHSAAGRVAVSTKTEDEDLSTKTLNGNQPEDEDTPLLTSPVPAEGNGDGRAPADNLITPPLPCVRHGNPIDPATGRCRYWTQTVPCVPAGTRP